MLNKANTMAGYTLHGLDGTIGTVKDLYFDDRHWTVRYLVADTGSWLIGKKVLISPYAVTDVCVEDEQITINLTKKQVEESPPLDTDKPVSKQFEQAYHGYYGWPVYWAGPSLWGPYPNIMRDAEREKDPTPATEISENMNFPRTGGDFKETADGTSESHILTQDDQETDPHLRSTHDVSGYHIQATDDAIGHVDDFLIDDELWAIRYLIVDTRNWWPGKKVLISPKWIERVSWDESKVFINLLRKTIKQSPEYSEESLLTRDYEIRLHGHYNRQGYWVDESSEE